MLVLSYTQLCPGDQCHHCCIMLLLVPVLQLLYDLAFREGG